MTAFVLIHGTTQAPAGWARLAAALEGHGHIAHAVDLPTDQPDLLADDYAQIITGQLAGSESPIVVAHSGSGMLLPAAARALRASHQVWLAAWIPNPDTSLAEEAASAANAIFNPNWLGKNPTTDPTVAAEFLFHDCDPSTLEWALTTLRLFHPRAPYNSRIERTDTIPSTYIVASADRTIRPEWQRAAARERLGITPIEVNAGHCPHVSQPESLAKLLSSLNR